MDMFITNDSTELYLILIVNLCFPS